MIIPKPIQNSYDVPGFNNQKHLNNLGKFARSIPEGSRVLEIGVGWGGSTWELMDSLPDGCKLYSCDTFEMNHPQLKERHYNGVMAKHSHNTAIAYAMSLYMEKTQRACFDWCVDQHPKRFKVLKGVFQKPSLEVLKEDSNWDMVYIDGLHSYENVSAELKFCENVPYLCGDDYHPAHEGTMRAIDEFVERNPERTFTHDDFETGSGFWTIV